MLNKLNRCTDVTLFATQKFSEIKSLKSQIHILVLDNMKYTSQKKRNRKKNRKWKLPTPQEAEHRP